MTNELTILGPQFSTFVRSVQLCCEEKNLIYRIGMDINGENIALGSEALFRYHPFGKVPVLVHGNRRFFETLVICRYLDTVFDGVSLYPHLAAERAEVEQWANCFAIYVDNLIIRRYLLEFSFPKGPQGSVRQDVIKTVEPDVIALLKMLDEQLLDRPFFNSDSFSVADAILIPMLDYLDKLPHSPQLFEQQRYLLPYLQRMRLRSSAKATLI